MPFKRFLTLCALVLCAVNVPALALEEVEYSTQSFTQSYVIPYIADFTKTPEGGVAWELLAKTEEESYQDVNEAGIDIFGVKPVFPPDVKALDGQEIVMQGYMFPLDPTEKQARFLFGPFPVDCPYHYHVGPALVIEAAAKEPMAFSFDPVTIRGTLTLVPLDLDFNIFYRMENVRLVK